MVNIIKFNNCVFIHSFVYFFNAIIHQIEANQLKYILKIEPSPCFASIIFFFIRLLHWLLHCFYTILLYLVIDFQKALIC